MFWLLVAAAITPGTIVDEVRCEADAAQSYALYLPSNYAPDRAWPIIMAFDPRGRGRTPVERYQAAAEKFGYIVVGSNNSRNGPWAVSMKAAQEMSADVAQRFRLDAKRVYAAGMSGGARVALSLALGSGLFAGVVASSAGYPDSKPRKTVPFALFGTAGSEDFNYREMRELDHALKSPHRLAIFAGGHVWLSSELAMEAVEWLELQAMASGRRERDATVVDRAFDERQAAAKKLTGLAALTALEQMAADFKPFKDVSAIAAQAAALHKEKAVREALKQRSEEDAIEERRMGQLLDLERQLPQSINDLRSEWKRLAADAKQESDTANRRVARRVMRSLGMSAGERTTDTEYRKLIAELLQRK